MQISSGSKRKDSEVLRRWLDRYVPRGEYNKIKSRMVETCLISASTFHNWLYGNCRIPAAGKRDINIVTKEFSGIEIFSIAKPETDSEGVSGNVSGKAI